MKGTLLLLITCLFYFAQAQTAWCPPGAKWTYPYGGFIFGTNTLEYVKDTTVDGQPCKQLKKLNYSSSGVPSGSVTYEYTFERNDTVFFWSGAFYPTFFFNAQVGETYLYKNRTLPAYSECDDYITLTIDSVGSIQINNETRSYYVASASSSVGPAAIQPATIKVIEGIGAVGFAMQPVFSCAITYDPVNSNLACYYDDSLGLFQRDTSVVCGSPTTAIESIAQTDVKIYPNPAHHWLHVYSNQDNSSLLIFAIDGQKVLQKPLGPTASPHAVDISDVQPGIYIYQITTPQGIVKTDKLVVE